MDDKTLRIMEESVITLLIAWLSYLSIYQNYLLYRWHRGLPLPSRIPALLGGLSLGTLYALYVVKKFEKEFE